MKLLKTLLAPALTLVATLTPLSVKAYYPDDPLFLAQTSFIHNGMTVSQCWDLLISAQREIASELGYMPSYIRTWIEGSPYVTHCSNDPITPMAVPATPTTHDIKYYDLMMVSYNAVVQRKDYDTAIINYQRALDISQTKLAYERAFRGLWAAKKCKQMVKSGNYNPIYVYDYFRAITGVQI
jgi:ribosomal protein L37AE/L43A